MGGTVCKKIAHEHNTVIQPLIVQANVTKASYFKMVPWINLLMNDPVGVVTWFTMAGDGGLSGSSSLSDPAVKIVTVTIVKSVCKVQASHLQADTGR